MKLSIVFLLIAATSIQINGQLLLKNSLVLKRINNGIVTNSNRIKRNSLENVPKIASLHIDSDISLRYANTTVTSNVLNPAETAKEVTFSVILPDTAFISGFIMKLDGQEYEAYVKEKEEAKKIYDEAVTAGQTAAHVATDTRDSNHFTVSINLEPAKKAEFKLKYEELLTRINGMYKMEININPGQFVEDMSVNVDIKEVGPISFVSVPLMSSGNEVEDIETLQKTDNPFTTTTISEDRHSAKVTFSPSKAEQVDLMRIFKEKRNQKNHTFHQPDLDGDNASNDEGLSGQFVVQYDVELDVGGQILINDGYFVHFFTPDTLKPLNKYVLFVLDVSGSMHGQKLTNLRRAMTSILDQLSSEDTFNIISFGSTAKVHKINNNELNMPTPVTPQNMIEAKNIVAQLQVNGLTNMEEALTNAFNLIDAQQSIKNINTTMKVDNMPIIMFLSDGDPNKGKVEEELITHTKTGNIHRAPIFSLAFGKGANRNFLRKLSLKNFGFMRPIYDSADAYNQLKNFFKTISSPLLTDVKYEYPKDQMEETTEPKFNHYFSGSSIFFAGKIKNYEPNDDLPHFEVTGNSWNGLSHYRPKILKQHEYKSLPMERLWAYLTIKQLMDERVKNEHKKPEIDKKATELALKYKFVTPLTSLVVVKPNSTIIGDPVEIMSKNKDSRTSHRKSYPSVVPLSLRPTPRRTYPSTAMYYPSGYSYSNAQQSHHSYINNKLAIGKPQERRPMSRGHRVGWKSIPIPTVVHQHSTQLSNTTIQQTVTVSPNLELYGLQNFPWIKQYLNQTTNSLTLPIGNTSKTFWLKSVQQSKPFPRNISCTNAVGGGSGECRYLTECSDINEGFKSLLDYSNHYCNISRFAGLCCNETNILS